LLENVTASRNGYAHATSNGQKMAMNDQLTMGLRSLFAVVENYPDLKANTNFLKLQDELSETEDKITYARQFYNDAVTIYNDKIQMFPGNMVAGIFGFREEELFNTVEDAKEAPKVQF
jgi:LemA protein